MIIKICRKSALRKRLRCLRLVEGGHDELGRVGHVIQSDEQIDVRKALFGLLRVALDKASRDDDHAA